MNMCEKTKAVINQYVDKELDIKEYNIINNHISQCTGCQMLEKKYVDIANNIKNLSISPVPQQLHNNIMRTVRNPQVTQNPYFVFSPKLGYILSTVAVVCILIGILPKIGYKNDITKSHVIGIEMLTPEVNALVSDNKTDVCARVKVRTKNKNLKVLLDKKDVTTSTEFIDDYLWYRPMKPLSDGYHTINIQVLDKTGEIITETDFSFLVFANNKVQ